MRETRRLIDAENGENTYHGLNSSFLAQIFPEKTLDSHALISILCSWSKLPQNSHLFFPCTRFFIKSLSHLWDKSATSIQLPDRKFNISTLTKLVTSCPLDRIVPNRICPSFTQDKKSFPQEAQRTPNQPFFQVTGH